jgi:threonine/homoserine/homoserine lactone efflux protein
VLGFTFVLLGLCSDGVYAVVAASVGRRIAERRAARARIERASGIAYIGLGVVAALARRPVPRAA